MTRTKGVKPIANLRPVLLGHWTVAYGESDRKYAVSAEVTTRELHVFIDGQGYSIDTKILFQKSIKDCINEIITTITSKNAEAPKDAEATA